MIQSSFIENRSVGFRVLSDDQIWEVKRAAFDVLSKTGCKIFHEGALKMLRQAGARVKDNLVKLPEHIVAECLDTAPKGFTIYDRDGNRAMQVEGRKSYYGTSTGSPYTMDALTGEVHQTTLADIAIGAKIADALPNIDWVMPMGSARDAQPPLAEEIYEFEALVSNTTKPMVMLSYSQRAFEMVYEMAAEVAGSLETLKERPFIIAYPEPITPLVFPNDVIEKMFFTADLEMPQIPGPVVQIGVTGPVTLAAGLAQLMAESLMAVTLIQLRKPGAPCFLSGNFAGFDMATSNISVGTPELSLGVAAQAEVAQSFGLPTWGVAGGTDAKVLDAQAGVEGTFSILVQGLAGLNLIHDVGYMDGSMLCSVAMLVLGDEVIGMTKRLVRGMEVNAETLDRALIEKIGPGGSYIQDEHTFNNFRKELWFPSLMTRQRYHDWQTQGAKNTAQRVQEKINKIVDTHKIAPLPDKVLAALEKIKQTGNKELSKA
jgi:trimethylamine--corrinoid protein Co-methyltransferase